MENYLVLNGQKIELTPEQYQEVCNAVSPKKSTFDKKRRVKFITILIMLA